jgi:hypothetical protein
MFEESVTNDVKQKYTLLELDTFYFAESKSTSTAYCLIENIPLQEMFRLEEFLDLHKNLIKNYKLKNWKYCEDALPHLIGKWNGDLDSFYKNISDRVSQHKEQDLDEAWTGVINRS